MLGRGGGRRGFRSGREAVRGEMRSRSKAVFPRTLVAMAAAAEGNIFSKWRSWNQKERGRMMTWHLEGEIWFNEGDSGVFVLISVNRNEREDEVYFN